ncbi:bifunctional 3-demethylubiquinol 3-O-methyltransferase/2-polyprenyl-6-hydroxyphenol methylase [Rickettsiella grylli]|uniref:bifunctional 2-polyprenyl-6-hydroxyphenol methylase/3-demethylubiquinol 3-O-methyltransferase UbiG n=1 Tax=Rickettsiella grylli TaxID=59196 RepID=UPI0008FD8B4C|nr:bifunctional 2-polyprenyl-6-hydroxyphenol methylase/3-demethylubiquinol 3-O-methyltransferase UbiG [Rickettsiella grylli]OIZ99476.1 bifunctional 3-demethylubiquinol 3-O-methyltransferase/2-polyprenyl-6-hydroxyphenol methylase [Rickettsiella grylli]
MLASNSDSAEINKFTALADQWWDVDGPCKPLHIINPLRLEFLETWQTLKGKKVIDVGCGGGIFAEAMAQRGAEVTGIDKSDALIDVAKKHAADNQLSIDYFSAEAESFATNQRESYDIVCCMELLEHVPCPLSLIQACSQLAKPNARIFFSTINRNPRAYFLAILGAEHFLKILPRGTHDYKKFIRPSELALAGRKAYLTLQKLQGIHYNPILQHYALSDDIRINYLAAFRKRA